MLVSPVTRGPVCWRPQRRAITPRPRGRRVTRTSGSRGDPSPDEPEDLDLASEFACVGCRADVLALGEFFMVRDDLWAATGLGRAFACVGCVEQRLGRTLTSADFPDVPVNRDEWGTRSPRLQRRLGS